MFPHDHSKPPVLVDYNFSRAEYILKRCLNAGVDPSCQPRLHVLRCGRGAECLCHLHTYVEIVQCTPIFLATIMGVKGTISALLI